LSLLELIDFCDLLIVSGGLNLSRVDNYQDFERYWCFDMGLGEPAIYARGWYVASERDSS